MSDVTYSNQMLENVKKLDLLTPEEMHDCIIELLSANIRLSSAIESHTKSISIMIETSGILAAGMAAMVKKIDLIEQQQIGHVFKNSSKVN